MEGVTMGRFDYPDPGTDPAYCDGLGGHPGIARACFKCGDTVFVSRDEAYQVQIFCERCQQLSNAPLADVQRLSEAVDPVEYAESAVMDAIKTLEREMAKADLQRVRQIKTVTRRVFAAIDTLDKKAMSKIGELVEKRR